MRIKQRRGRQRARSPSTCGNPFQLRNGGCRLEMGGVNAALSAINYRTTCFGYIIHQTAIRAHHHDHKHHLYHHHHPSTKFTAKAIIITLAQHRFVRIVRVQAPIFAIFDAANHFTHWTTTGGSHLFLQSSLISQKCSEPRYLLIFHFPCDPGCDAFMVFSFFFFLSFFFFFLYTACFELCISLHHNMLDTHLSTVVCSSL